MNLFQLVLKRVTLVFIIVAVFIGLIISISFLISPLLNARKSNLEAWASDLLQMPVTIQQARMSWHYLQPGISLDNVVVENKENKAPILQVKNIKIFLSITKSLWRLRFIPSDVRLSGSEVNLVETEANRITLRGLPDLTSTQVELKPLYTPANLLGVLAVQPAIRLQNIDIRYVDLTGKKLFLTLHDLHFRNRPYVHTIQGKAILHQEKPTEINTMIRWEGNEVDLDKLKANLYVELTGLSLPQWLQTRSFAGLSILQGEGNAKVWGTWAGGSFSQLKSTFQLADLRLKTQRQLPAINRFSGTIHWQREANGLQILSGEDILLDFSGSPWPLNKFYLSFSSNDQMITPKVMQFSYLNLGDIAPLLLQTDLLSDNTRHYLSQHMPRGNLQNVSATFNGPMNDLRQMSFAAHLDKISIIPWERNSYLGNVTGDIKWNGQQGEFLLNSNRFVFRYDPFFIKPINFAELSGRGTFSLDQANQWIIQTNGVHISNNDLTMDLKGGVTLPVDQLPITDLAADFAIPNAKHISQYLPLKSFSPELTKWLNAAFLQGEVRSGHLILRGILNDFPFAEGKGVFSISGSVHNVELHFAPNWPNLTHINGNLLFSGPKLFINADNAQISGIKLSRIEAHIPDLSAGEETILHVKAEEIPSNFAKAFQFIHHSPLNQTIGKMFAGVELQGPFRLKLNLDVPLNDPKNTSLNGWMTLQQATLNVPAWDVRLNQLHGLLHFTENAAFAKQLNAELFNKPVVIDINTEQRDNQSVIKASLTERWNLSELAKHFNIDLPDFVKGETQISSEFEFSKQTPVLVNLRSDLVGVQLDLPDHLAKSTEASRPSAASISIEENKPLRIKFQYGAELGAAFLLEKKQQEMTLSGLNLQLGEGTPSWPEGKGITITGNFEQLDWAQIQSYLNQSDSKMFSDLKVENIDIRAKTLQLGRQELKQVQLTLKSTDDQWIININSPDVEGEIRAPQKFNREGHISARFSKLTLHEGSRASGRDLPALSLANMPGISLSIERLKYDELNLGRLKLESSPSGNGQSINLLELTSPFLFLRGNGQWQKDSTHLRGRASSDQVSALLRSFGFNVNNFVAGHGFLDFNLAWEGSLFTPNVQSLSGNARLDLGAGRIVEVGQASGAKMDIARLLSIFSLQALPRRLALDFSDVAQRGYAFDSLKGDFTLRQGNATTQNLRFEGTLARVDISGRIGLSRKDVDLRLNVVPHVSSTLPVAATLMAGTPVVGIAAMAVNTMLSSQVSRAATYSYTVRGSWSNPVWGSR